MKKSRDMETFSLSFLDAVTCAFGAVILLLVLTKIYEPQIIERSKQELIGLIAALQQELFEMRGEIAVMNRELLTVEEQLSSSGRRLSSLRTSVTEAQGRYDAMQIDSLGDIEERQALLAARQSLTEEMKKLLAEYQPEPGDTTVGGIPVDSEYIIFVIDSSGSMQAGAWRTVVDTVEDTLKVYPDIKGIQVIDTDGYYLDAKYTGSWIPDTPTNRRRILKGIKNMRQARSSSPRRGLQKAIEKFYQPGLKISICIFGDDFDEDRKTIEQVANFVDSINTSDEFGNRLVRIHAVAFPVHVGQFNERFIRFSHLMRTLCERNGGTFIALTESTGGGGFRIQIGARQPEGTHDG
jgi:hypothetical protein